MVKAFNTTFAATLVPGQEFDVFIAGDDDNAKHRYRCWSPTPGCAPSMSARRRGRRQREELGFLHIALQQPHDLGFGSAIKLHP